jgi:polar amino acid transport system ATP-binding protein
LATDSAPGTMTTGVRGNGEPIIRFDKVVKRFGDNVVLRELNFNVAPASG